MTPVGEGDDDTFSVYVHVPFCRTKCPYCHFYTVSFTDNDAHAFTQAIVDEWRRWRYQLPQQRLCSMYFGGGTPSVLPQACVAKIADAVLGEVSSVDDVEVTLEANPGDITAEHVTGLVSAGVNRISMGVQSFHDPTLRLLGRRHTADDAKRAVDTIWSGGVDNISIDLMYECPEQLLADWTLSLHTAVALPIKHVSVYNLVLEPKTPFFRHRKALESSLPAEDESSAMLTETEQILKEGLFERYEISAFAREKTVSRHNVGYWQGRPFIGLGPSAFSYWQGRRFRNVADSRKYLRAVSQGRNPVDFEETLPRQAHLKERFVIGLRMVCGVDIAAFQRCFGKLGTETLSTVETLADAGLITVDGGNVSLSERGVRFYDTVAAELI